MANPSDPSSSLVWAWPAAAQAGESEAGGEWEPELIARAVGGDAGAFERLMALHERRVFRTALRLLGGRIEDAQDASQEVFLRFHRSLGRFRGSQQVNGWLYRVTVNVCRDLERRSRRRVTLPLEGVAESGGAQARSGPGTPLHELEEAERRELIRQAVAALPLRQRAALVLRDLEGLAGPEVARILGSSEGTIRSQISAARSKIREFLSKRLEERR